MAVDRPAEPPPERPVVIAIDGPAASGKGTLARRVAAHFGYAHLDTGLLYRAVGMKVLRGDNQPDDEAAALSAARQLRPVDLEGPDLRTDRAANVAGVVAAMADVREALLDYQRGFAANPPGGEPGVVLDGRDIGTVICPDADHKIFVDADVKVRADRRLKELQERGTESIPSRVLQDMKERDARDRKRAVAPLTSAEDAFILDTTALDADAAFAAAINFITSRDRPG